MMILFFKFDGDMPYLQSSNILGLPMEKDRIPFLLDKDRVTHLFVSYSSFDEYTEIYSSKERYFLNMLE
jgi:hypothetical protein